MTRWFIFRAFTLSIMLVALAGCHDDDKLQGAGDECVFDSHCSTGKCLDGKCVEADAGGETPLDTDGDGLLDTDEVSIGTNPENPDTDGDGKPDGDEVQSVGSPGDEDGDGKIDALESCIEDEDDDCVPDQQDPDSTPADPLTLGQLAGCTAPGICADVQVPGHCENDQIVCDVQEVPGYEAEEASCDGLDNDCDGSVDEDLGVGDPCDGDDTDECANGTTECGPDGAVVCGDETATDIAEICDGDDNDCDGDVDEGFELGAACDSDDTDECENGVMVCNAAGDGVECGAETITDIAEICDGVDNDCDTEVDEDFDIGVACDGDDSDECENGLSICNAAGDGVECGVEAATNIPDVCDGVDNDCDGEIDEDFDLGLACDGDDADECENGLTICNAAGDGVECGAEASTDVAEICDGLDNDCDGTVDEGFDLGSACDGDDSDECENGLTVCNAAGDGVECGAETVTDIAEVCDGADNDCDTEVDEGFDLGTACDTDDTDDCENGLTICNAAGDGVECGAETVTDIAEICDGLDNDCDTDVDEGFDIGLFCDTDDTDDCENGLTICNAAGDGVECGPETVTDIAEICDGLDNDCDTDVDEGFDLGLACDTDDTDDCENGLTVCNVAGDGTVCGVETVTNIPETCDGVDNDCDNDIDEGFDLGAACDTDDSDECKNGLTECNAVGDGVTCISETVTDIAEVCGDQLDNDCDGTVDEDCVTSICGTVTALGPLPLPIAGASVSLAGGTAANVVAGAVTDAAGHYCIDNVPMQFADAGGFFMSAKHEGYATENKSSTDGDFVVVAGTENTVDFQLEPLGEQFSCLDEDFETETAWTTTESGLGVGWTQRPNGTLLNSAVGTCAVLAADESCAPGDGCAICANDTDPACIPTPGAIGNAYSGNWAFWFGHSENGNYLSEGGTCDAATAGGLGESVSGSLTSPPFEIDPSLEPTLLRFRSWWEIESVDPQPPEAFGYDQMRVEIVDVTGAVTLIGWMNPAIDQNGGNDEPYSSGGYLTAPTWNLYEFDVSAFAGQQVQIQFTFDSADGSYNAFRGWVVDKVSVTGGGCLPPPPASICGTVTTAGPVPVGIADATVSLAGGTPDNVVTSATTDENGDYCILDVPMQFADQGGFFMAAKREGYFTQHKSTDNGDFVVIDNQENTVDFQLLPQPEEPLCIAEDFEGPSDWTTSDPVLGVGWAVRQNGSLVNTAVGQCTVISELEDCAPGPGCPICADKSDPGCIPEPGSVGNAWNGAGAMWFGDPGDGNYLSDGAFCDDVNLGGSGEQVAGSLTSPPILLNPGNGVTTLRFRAWWEIEAVDPQAPNNDGYDQMRVEVVDAQGLVTLIGWMNPDIDQDGEADEPYSSGGYLAPPTWNLYEFDLSPFAGQEISVQFTFDSDDGSYNGFRGWIVDTITVSGDACGPPPPPMICGQITDILTGVPLVGASVTLSVENAANVVAGTNTDDTGSYCIEDVPPGYDNLGGYFVTAKHTGYLSALASSVAGDFAVLPVGTTTVDLALALLPPNQTCFEDSFEIFTPETSWTASGFIDGVGWNRRANALLTNAAIGMCVALSDTEANCVADPSCGICVNPTDPGCMPAPGSIGNAWDGLYAYWFGNPSTGTYTGSYLGGTGICGVNDGGTSSAPAMTGTLTSRKVFVPAGDFGTATLQFRSWFEIESVDAQAPPPFGNGYDGMYIELVDPATGAVNTIGYLNPEVDVSGNLQDPYSSGGHLAPPVWNLYEFDIASEIPPGNEVQVQFRFDTLDGSYNGFRGWLIDDVRIVGTKCQPN